MTELSVSSLDSPMQRLVENTRVALARGDFDYAADVCGQILEQAPACLAVRRMQRDAQLHQQRSRSGRFFATLEAVAGRALRPAARDPELRLRWADRVLAQDPTSSLGLRTLAEAAAALGWKETAAFAWEALRDLQPDDVSTLLGLAQAYLEAQRPREARATAEQALRLRPGHAAADALVREAAVVDAAQAGRWTASGDFRTKLRTPPEEAAEDDFTAQPA